MSGPDASNTKIDTSEEALLARVIQVAELIAPREGGGLQAPAYFSLGGFGVGMSDIQDIAQVPVVTRLATRTQTVDIDWRPVGADDVAAADDVVTLAEVGVIGSIDETDVEPSDHGVISGSVAELVQARKTAILRAKLRKPTASRTG